MVSKSRGLTFGLEIDDVLWSQKDASYGPFIFSNEFSGPSKNVFRHILIFDWGIDVLTRIFIENEKFLIRIFSCEVLSCLELISF